MNLKTKIFSVLMGILFSSILLAEEFSAETKKHVNPMPDFMQVIDSSGDKLNLDENQQAKLKKWQSERVPVEQRLIKEIIKAEADIYKAALDDEELSKIDQLGDSILQNRLMLIRNKAFTREKIKAILTADQWKQLLEIYKSSYKK